MPTDPRFPVRFDAHPWEEDTERSSSVGREAAQTAREDYETDGVPRSHLKPCESEGRDGTNLPDCAKGLPAPTRRPLRHDLHDRQTSRQASVRIPRLRRTPPPARRLRPDRV